MSNLHHLARYQYQIEVFPVSHLEHAHAAKIFGWAALCFSVAGIFKIRRAPGLVIAIGPNCSLCAHFGKKLEVNGVKASLANVL